MSRLESALGIFTDPRHFKVRLLIEGLIIGTFTGGVISAFRFLLQLSETALPRLYAFLAQEPQYVPLWMLVLAGIGYIIYRLVACDGMISGSGIPQIKGILAGQMNMNWARVLVLKFTGAVLGIGAGMSLGREGPSVQLGACLGQGLGRLTHRSYAEDHYLLTAGAGAGLAAAFNAPLAGVIFCLEELTKDFSPYVLLGAISASVMATTVTQLVFGMEPVFHMGVVPVVPTGGLYVLLIAMGIFVGVLGLGFNKMLTRSLDADRDAPRPAWAKPMVPLAGALVLGFVLPQVLGGGSLLVDSLVYTRYTLLFLLVLLAGKFFFTMLCFGSGVPGGIFLPMLVLGAIGGAVFARVAVLTGCMGSEWVVDCIVFGMAAYFAAVVKSPVTGSILIMEMTGSFEHMLALITVSMTAYVVADLAGSEPVYDMLLNRSLAQRQRIATQVRHHRVMLELLVSRGSRIDGAAIADVPWPAGSLIVDVRRGTEEIAPSGEVQLQHGDYLYVLTEADAEPELQSLAAERQPQA